MNNARNLPGADVRLRRGAEHLNVCGARVTAKFMLAFARAHDIDDDLLTLEAVVAAGADRFPPLLQLVSS